MLSTIRRSTLYSLFALAVVALSASTLHAQDSYHLYLDVDSNSNTGCSEAFPNAPGTTSGGEKRLTAVIDGQPPQVVDVIMESCSGGGTFGGAGISMGGGYPVALNTGVGGSDAIELSLPASSVGIPSIRSLGLQVAARTSRGTEDVLLTRDGSPGTGPIIFGIPFEVPIAGLGGLLLLGALVVLIGMRAKRQMQRRALLSVGMLLWVGVAIAGGAFMVDGDISDWGGTSSIATDPAGDASGNDAAADLRALFVALSGNELFFRIDVTDLENQPPVANSQAVSTLEDQASVITLSGSDPNGDPLSFAIIIPPSQGILSPVIQLTPTTAQVTYTPDADYFGADSFTFNVDDGQVGSPEATVSITIGPVNDAPSFVAANPAAVLEDAGALSLPFATFSPGPANESGQSVLAYAVTGVTNAALFAAGPTVANDGTLSYTPAADANGSSDFTVTVQDNGGTASGGVDTSAPQTFSISVNPVNDAPVFTAGPDQTVLEDSAAQTVNPWATGLSPGPADESGQTLSFNITGNSDPSLFSAGPTVAPNGALTYTPAANAVGVATIDLTLMDDGGTANGGADTSAPQSFTITITGINDVPVFTAGADQTVLEDAGAQSLLWATGIDDGDPDVTQGLTFNITSNDNTGLFAAGPAVAADGTLSYTPADDANGSAIITLNLMDDGGTTNGGIDTSVDQTFTINVTAVNDAPDLTATDPAAVLEDAGAQTVAAFAAFNPGPADEAGQVVVAYQVSAISNAGLFATAPSVANDGTLSYTPAADANGTSTFDLTVQDDGGTADGGVDTSTAQTFTISVTAVNDVPSFTAGPDQTVNEDAGAQVVAPWATGISAGPANESAQTLAFNVSGNSNPGLFSAGPAIAADGSLSYTPAANANGSAMITLNVMDSGGTANGGIDTSGPQTFTINVTTVNNVPVFNAGANEIIDEDAGAQTVAAWATGISPGPADESGQVVTFNITGNTNAALFSAGPAVASDGTLSYTAAADASGTATIMLNLMDDGGTANGGVDTSADQSFTITVNPINDPPVNTVPGMQSVSGGMLEFSTANTNTITVLDIDADPGTVQVDISVTAGTLDAVDPTPGVTISNNTSAAVTLVGLQTDINIALDGLLYVPSGAGSDTLTVLTDDLGNTGAPGPLTDSDTVTIFIDEAPFVAATNPAEGGVKGLSGFLTVNFSENATFAPGAIQILCLPSGATRSEGGFSGNGIAIPNFGEQAGDSCTLTAFSASITDVDAIDPPDELDGNNDGDGIDGDVDNFVLNYSIDAAPAFVISSPVNGATVANTAVFAATFSEPVDLGMGALTLDCGGPIAVTPSGSGTTTLTFTPVAALPNGASCTATLIAANITDSDSFDPPDNLPGNVVVNFSVDAAPQITGGAPADTASQVATNTNVTFDFSEGVNGGAGAITVDCGGAVAGALSGSGGTTLTFNPSANLPENTLCTATAVAAQIDDVDALDPPANPPADVVRTFTTDAAPSVLSTAPTNGALLQPPTGTITINFSEMVNFDVTANAANTSFDLECPAATAAGFSVSTASPASSVVLDPADLDIAGLTCTLTIRAAGITDADAGDPPDNMLADVVVVIGYDDPAIAIDDTYNVNPHLTLAIDTAIQSGRVLANDTLGSAVITGFGPLGTCAAAVPNGANFITTAGGGRVVLNLNGSFSYAPPAGLVGNGAGASPEDGFCYTITGGDTADVGFEFALHNLVWFANSAYAGANGPADGTQARPHVDLPSIAAVDTANDTIHLLASVASYTGATLESGTRLIGTGASSNLATITGISPVAGSAFPALGGPRPTIAGAGINLAPNNTIRGLNIGNSPEGLVAGAPFGTLTMSEASILGTGRAINFNATGTLNVVLDELSSSGGFNGVILSGVGGTLSVGAGGTNIGSTTGGSAIFIQLAPAATNFNFGAATITSSADGVTANVNTPASVIAFTSLAITTPTGAGLVSNSGTINIGGVNNTINSTGGPALNLTNTNTGAGWTFSTLSSTNSAATGIRMNGATGGITATGGAVSGSVSSALQIIGLTGFSHSGTFSKTSSGVLIEIVNGTSGDVTLSGNLSCTGACAQGAVISNRTGGTMTFSGAAKTFSSAGAQNAVRLLNNTGSTINFTGGGLAATSTTGRTFEATGGGTISVTGAGNTLSNGAATALNVQNTTVGASGLIFQSINSNGGTNGIVLNNTGTNAALTVTGVGTTAGTGGTIQSKSGDGLRLQSTQGINLSNMNLTNTATTGAPSGTCGTNVQGNTTCTAAIDMSAVANVTLNRLAISGTQQYGINGNGVAAFSLSNSSINNSGNQVDEDGIRFINLTGTSLIRNTAVVDSHSNNLRVFNTVATPLTLTIDETVAATSRFVRALNNDGILFEGINSANMTLNVSDTNFDSSDGDHIQTAINDVASMDITIANNTMTATNPTVLGSGITLSSSGDFSGTKAFSITGNSINGSNAKAINVNLGTTTAQGGTGTYTGTIANNLIGTSGVTDSGGSGMTVSGIGGGTVNATINNNTIRQFDSDHGIRVLQADGNGRINATVTNNVVTQPEPGGFNGVVVQVGASSSLPDSGTICLDINGNTMAGSGGGGGSATDFRLRQRFSTTFQLRGYTGVSGDTAAVVTFVQGANPGAETGSATTQAPGTGFINSPGGGACN